MSALEDILKQCDKVYNEIKGNEGWKVFENIRRELQQALADTDVLIFRDTRTLNGINEEDDEIILKQNVEIPQPLSDNKECITKVLEHNSLKKTHTPSQLVNEKTAKPACKKSNTTAGEKTLNGFASEHEEQENNDLNNQDRRPKRGASYKALASINKQCSQKLNQKLRRPTNKDENHDVDESERSSSKEKQTNKKKSPEIKENKENIDRNLPVKIKQERISENVSNSTVDSTQWATPNSTMKPEQVDDLTKMPPPPDPTEGKKKRQQGTRATENLSDASSHDDSAETSTRRSRRVASKKDSSVQAGNRTTRASSRNVTQDAEFLVPPAPMEHRPKRTRAKKVHQVAAETSLQVDSSDGTESVKEVEVDVPQIPIIEKPRPKRTRKGKRNTKDTASRKEQIEQEVAIATIAPTETNPAAAGSPGKKSTDKLGTIANGSPILPSKSITKGNLRKSQSVEEKGTSANNDSSQSKSSRKRTIDLRSSGRGSGEKRLKMLDQRETTVLTRRTASLDRNSAFAQSLDVHTDGPQDKSTVLSSNVQDAEDIYSSAEKYKLNGDVQMTSPLNNKCMNETVVIENKNTNIARETVVIEKAYPNIARATVVIEKVNPNIARETVVIEKANPKIARETVVIEKTNPNIARGTVVLSAKEPNKIMNETVTINNEAGLEEISNSLITDDSSAEEHTPPRLHQYKVTEKPSSAVKERVQQFEEMTCNVQATTTRVTRTKTRAMANKANEEVESVPFATGKVNALSADTLSKLMFTGSHTKQQASSAAKVLARSNIIGSGIKSFLPSSLTKPVVTRPPEDVPARRAADRDEAMRKKEAMLEAQREERKQRRELKMAAAAAAREAAARERQAAIEAQARDKEKREQQLQAEKIEKLKETERKRQALERRQQEKEERRRAEEAARQARLEEEQRLAADLRKRQLEEAESARIEALNNEKQIQAARQKYLAKEKERKKILMMKQRLETDKGHTPMKTGGGQMPPVHKADGFEYLNSDDSDDEKPAVHREYADWTKSKARWHRLGLQVHIAPAILDRLFSVRAHTPDLRAVFPYVNQRVLKRTSSAVWRTPPGKPATIAETAEG